jgi:catechol 2,3-dioxygenase-like lactoylglutathione lyase family enzyme
MDTMHHVAIEVKDIKEAVDTYTSKFACEVAYQDDTWAMLKFANIFMAFVLPGSHPPHVCFTKDDAENYGTLKTHRDGTETVYIGDGQGNAIEIMKTSSLPEFLKM